MKEKENLKAMYKEIKEKDYNFIEKLIRKYKKEIEEWTEKK